MDLLVAIRNNSLVEYKRTFTWRSSDGRSLTLDDMDSVHILNSAKLLARRIRPSLNTEPLYVRRGETYQTQYLGRNESALQRIFYFTWELAIREAVQNKNFQREQDRVSYREFISEIYDGQFLNVDLVRALPPSPPVPDDTLDIMSFIGVSSPTTGRESAQGVPYPNEDSILFGTPALSGLWPRHWLSDDPLGIGVTNCNFTLTDINDHLDIARHSDGNWNVNLRDLQDEVTADFDEYISNMAAEVNQWLRERRTEFAQHTGLRIREDIIRHIYAILDHNVSQGTLTRTGWHNYVPLNQARVQPQASSRFAGSNARPAPQRVNAVSGRNPLLMVFDEVTPESRREEKVNSKSKAHSKMAAEKVEQQLTGMGKRKIQVE